MDYRWLPHLPSWHKAGAACSASSFALVDAGQLNTQTRTKQKTLDRLVSNVEFVRLFEGLFPDDALPLSPWLIRLNETPEPQVAQIEALDEACHALPVLSLLRSDASLQELHRHLQSHLRIKADGDDFLLRLADMPTLRAACAVMQPSQRASLLAPVQAWWTLDHEGRVHDAATLEQAQPAFSLPISFSMEQLAQLLCAMLPCLLASQLRSFEPSFARACTHAQQCQFVDREVKEAVNQALKEEEWLPWLIQRWQEQAPNA